MKTTVISALMMFLAYFLVLYGEVGFIQDKRFFSSAPKENLQAIPDKKERFPGAHILGWAIEGVAVLLFLAAAALGIGDGVRNGFGFWAFLRGFSPCSMRWSSTTSFSLTGCCCATRAFSRIFTRS